jgi:hypothetical protein
MGPDGGLVAPGLPTRYTPSTVVVVRRSAIGAGFDESLHIGEAVDLVWRLSLAGWLVRYEPTEHVWHDHRVELRAFIARPARHGTRARARSEAGMGAAALPPLDHATECPARHGHGVRRAGRTGRNHKPRPTAVLGDAAVRPSTRLSRALVGGRAALQERTIRPLLPSWGPRRVDAGRPSVPSAPSLVVELGPAHAP